jgi:hypothetical protein
MYEAVFNLVCLNQNVERLLTNPFYPFSTRLAGVGISSPTIPLPIPRISPLILH